MSFAGTGRRAGLIVMVHMIAAETQQMLPGGLVGKHALTSVRHMNVLHPRFVGQ